MEAWKTRVEPHLEEFKGKTGAEILQVLDYDSESAYYDNYFSIM